MKIADIDKRIDTLKSKKQNIKKDISNEKKAIEKILLELEKNLLISKSGTTAAKKPAKKNIKTNEVNSNDEVNNYLKYRDKVSDLNFFKNVEPLLKNIPDSNGSRYFQKSNVNVGIIADEFLYQSFKDVANFHYITSQNYKDYENKIDIFFVATTWKGLNMEWRGLANPESNRRKELYQIIKFFKQNKVKTVFYSKEDPVNYDKFVDIAKECEYIFTTAVEKVEDYKNECKNDNVFVLEFGINPLYHNPVGMRNVQKSEDVFFAGSWLTKYPDRQGETLDIFDGVINADRKLKIVDRNFAINHPDYFFPKQYLQYISPAIGHENLQKIHKLYDWAINLNSIKFSDTMFANRIYELQAIGNIIFSNYSVGVNNKFPNVFIINDKNEVKEILNGFDKEAIYSHQTLGIRNVMSSHTTFERFDHLLECIGEEKKLVPKKVLVVADVINDHVSECFERQSFLDKTLISESELTEELKMQYDMIAFFNANHVYQEYYLEDMVNGFKYTNSDYITKDSYFNGPNLISGVEHNYVAKMKDKYKSIFWASSFDANKLLELKTEEVLENGYSIDHFELNEAKDTVQTETTQTYELSVIVPVYNNGKYLLNKCFNSLRRSSIFDTMEIIMIDDGSSDVETITTINRIAEQYKNVTVHFYNDNGSGSASRPRNKGAELASTKYITYLDPDNEAVNDGYARLLEEMKRDNELDMVIGNMTKLDNIKKGAFNYYKTVTESGYEDMIVDPRNLLIETNLKAQSIQALVVKKEIITDNKLKMVENAGGQDTLFFHELLLSSKKAKVINLDIHIYYAAVTGSVTNTITKKFFNKFHTIEIERLPFLQKNNLLEVYMEKRFNFYFKNWYLKRINKIDKEDQKESIDTLYHIYSLYEKHITQKDKDIAHFVSLYENQNYEQIINYFSKK
jgi:glycosyltransferase involved in cell wall biosynthesis